MGHAQNQNPMEVPPSERPGYRPEGAGREGPRGVTLEPTPETLDAAEQNQVAARKAALDEATTLLLEATDPAELARVGVITGVELGDEEAARLLAQQPSKRLGILLRVPTLSEADHAFLEGHPDLKITLEQFQRQKAVHERWDRTVNPDAFEVEKGGQVRLSAQERREAQARKAWILDLRAKIETGGFAALSVEEREEVNGLLTQALQVEEYVLALYGNPEAQQEVYALLNQGDLSAQELIARMVSMELKYALGPKAQKDQAVQAEEAKAELKASQEAQEAAMMDTLGLDPAEVEVVGRNGQGDMILRVGEDLTCTVQPAPGGTFVVNAIQVDLLGTEFRQQQPAQVSNPREFAEVMGRARLQAALARYQLPFDGPEQDRVIEIFAKETTEVQEFTYDQYPRVEPSFLAFLRTLAPRREEDQVQKMAQRLGFLDRTGGLVEERWRQVVYAWFNLSRTNDPEEILRTLRQMYER